MLGSSWFPAIRCKMKFLQQLHALHLHLTCGETDHIYLPWRCTPLCYWSIAHANCQEDALADCLLLST